VRPYGGGLEARCQWERGINAGEKGKAFMPRNPLDNEQSPARLGQRPIAGAAANPNMAQQIEPPRRTKPLAAGEASCKQNE